MTRFVFRAFRRWLYDPVATLAVLTRRHAVATGSRQSPLIKSRRDLCSGLFEDGFMIRSLPLAVLTRRHAVATGSRQSPLIKSRRDLCSGLFEDGFMIRSLALAGSDTAACGSDRIPTIAFD